MLSFLYICKDYIFNNKMKNNLIYYFFIIVNIYKYVLFLVKIILN